MHGHETQTRTVLTTQTRKAAGTAGQRLPFRCARDTLCRVLLGGLLCAALPVGSVLHAQPAPRLVTGDRIRISSPKVPAKQTGRFVRIDGEPLVLKRDRTGDTVSVSLADWSQVELGQGRPDAGERALRYAGIGFLAGGATGLVLGYLSYQEPPPGSLCPMLCSRRETAVAAGVLLGIAGGVVGGLIGALSPPERWERVTPPQGLSVGATAGEGLALSVTLRR